jgi:hypothetical protein
VGVATSSIVGGQNLNFATPANLINKIEVRDSYPVPIIGALAISDLEYEGLNGPVRSFFEKSAKLDMKNRLGPSIPRIKKVFDERGILVETQYFKSGQPNGRTFMFYDDRGLKEKHAYISEDGKRSEYAIADRVRVTAGGRSYSDSFGTWDAENQELDHRTRDNRGQEVQFECPARSEKWLTTFDLGRESETKVFRSGVLDTIYKYEYAADSRGNWTTKKEYIWMAEFPDAGFSLSAIYTRKLEYFY